MNGCLGNSDVEQIGQEALASFELNIANIPKDLCAPFFQEASNLEAKLITIFGMVSRICRNEPDAEKVSQFWGVMVLVCEGAERKVAGLYAKHPNCGADQFFDRLHQLKSKCKRLQLMHS